MKGAVYEIPGLGKVRYVRIDDENYELHLQFSDRRYSPPGYLKVKKGEKNEWELQVANPPSPFDEVINRQITRIEEARKNKER